MCSKRILSCFQARAIQVYYYNMNQAWNRNIAQKSKSRSRWEVSWSYSEVKGTTIWVRSHINFSQIKSWSWILFLFWQNIIAANFIQNKWWLTLISERSQTWIVSVKVGMNAWCQLILGGDRKTWQEPLFGFWFCLQSFWISVKDKHGVVTVDFFVSSMMLQAITFWDFFTAMSMARKL